MTGDWDGPVEDELLPEDEPLPEDGAHAVTEPVENGSDAGRSAASRRTASRRPRAFVRLYRGQTSFNFIGRKRWWFTLSAVVIVAGILSLGFRGLNFGIDFKGGTSWTASDNGASVAKIQTAVTDAGLTTPTIEILGGRTVEVQGDLNSLPAARQTTVSNQVEDALAKVTHTSTSQVSVSNVGPTWGGNVTSKAIEALVVFFILIALYISVRFEWKMAVAAIIAVLHDIMVTVGVYSLAGFQVTPDTVVAVLTILGYSLYDTVVVFDRVRENSKGFGSSGRMSYSDMVNLSMNQTLARSLNTSLVAILPVFAILVIGAEILGATTLQDFGLALLVGLISGAYSSIFIASPILALLKEREPRYAAIRQRLATRSDRLGLLSPAAAAAMASAGAAAGVRAGGSGGSPGQARRGARGSGRGAAGGRRAPAGRGPAGGGAEQAPGGPLRPSGSPSKGTGAGASAGFGTPMVNSSATTGHAAQTAQRAARETRGVDGRGTGSGSGTRPSGPAGAGGRSASAAGGGGGLLRPGQARPGQARPGQARPGNGRGTTSGTTGRAAVTGGDGADGSGGAPRQASRPRKGSKGRKKRR